MDKAVDSVVQPPRNDPTETKLKLIDYFPNILRSQALSLFIWIFLKSPFFPSDSFPLNRFPGEKFFFGTFFKHFNQSFNDLQNIIVFLLFQSFFPIQLITYWLTMIVNCTLLTLIATKSFLLNRE